MVSVWSKERDAAAYWVAAAVAGVAAVALAVFLDCSPLQGAMLALVSIVYSAAAVSRYENPIEWLASSKVARFGLAGATVIGYCWFGHAADPTGLPRGPLFLATATTFGLTEYVHPFRRW